MNSEDAPLTLTLDGPVAHLLFNRPAALNAINVPMALAFRDAMRTIAASSDIRVVILKGAGRAFIAGGDLASLRENPLENAQALIAPLHEALAIMTGLSQPVIASVHGAVAGAGVSIALACDFVLAAQGTRFNLAYASIGTSPDASASWHLPRLVGLHKAMELLLLSEPFDADEALRLGLIGKKVAAEQLQVETERLANRLAQGPTFALGQTKRLLRNAFQRSLEEQLDAEREGFCACTQTEDFGRGIEAFFTKEKAHYLGS